MQGRDRQRDMEHHVEDRYKDRGQRIQVLGDKACTWRFTQRKIVIMRIKICRLPSSVENLSRHASLCLMFKRFTRFKCIKLPF